MRRKCFFSFSSLSSYFAKKEDEPLFFLFVGPESEIHQEDFFLGDAKPTNVMNESPCCGKRPRPRFFLVLQIWGKIRKAKKSRVCSVSSEKNCSVMTKMFSLDLQHSTSKLNFFLFFFLPLYHFFSILLSLLISTCSRWNFTFVYALSDVTGGTLFEIVR